MCVKFIEEQDDFVMMMTMAAIGQISMPEKPKATLNGIACQNVNMICLCFPFGMLLASATL